MTEANFTGLMNHDHQLGGDTQLEEAKYRHEVSQHSNSFAMRNNKNSIAPCNNGESPNNENIMTMPAPMSANKKED
jgi:hypothetical protein